MAGIHQYTSSQFIQSGSAAEFKTGVTASEITVEGTVFATEYKKLDGSLITGTGGVEFFAGSGSGVSRSLAEGGPFSQDHFFKVEGDNKQTEDNKDVLIPGLIKIETTGSSTFNPNYFNFIKVGNDSEDLITVQQGSNPSYIPESISERQAGTHRYIIYAAQTGSSGETHQVFHTVTLDAFVNEKPVIVPGDNTSFNISITHDSNIGSIIMHSTESTDANIEAGEADHFTKYKVIETSAQTAAAGLFSNEVYSSYNIELIHPNDISENTTELEIIEPLSPGLPNSTLFASASLTNYNLKFSRGVGVFPEPNGNDFIITSPNTGIVEYTVRLEDFYPNDAVTQGFNEVTYKINITPPNTASIKNSRVEFEPIGFSSELTSTLEQTLLYDFDHTLNSSSIKDLHPRYTSSLVRLKALADIIEPEDGLNPPFDHYTKILIQTESSTTIDNNSPTLTFFRFNGNELTASALDLTNINGGYTTPTESNGFNSFEFYPNYTNNTQSLFIGQHNEGSNSNNKKLKLNRTSKVQHGTNNHFQVFVNDSPSTLILKRPHDINISDISIEVASGSYEPIPSHQLTSSLLYGFTSSLLSDQTQSLITDIYDTSTPFRTTEMLDKFLSQSIVKVRVKAKITEPFGPTHNNIPTTLSDGNGKSVTFNFSSESNDFFTNSPTYEDVNGQELLVGRYTSSWKEFKFEPKNESYEFGVEFTNPSTNVGLTIEEYISASITMSNSEPIQISNVVVEIESGSFATNLGHPSLTSSLLYGLTSSLTSSQTSSFITNKIVGLSNHIHHLDYISQSIVRSRIKTRITEPFGPITSDISASITSNNLGVTLVENNNNLSINLPSHTSTDLVSTLEGIINISNEGSNPSFISILDTITLTKIEIRGSLGENSTINNGDNKLISDITIGNNNLLDNLTSNGDINGDGINDTAAAVNVIYATGADTYDSNGFSFTNNGDFAPIFIGNESVNLINGDVIFSIQIQNISNLEVRLTFNEPESSTDPFLSEKFLFQADQSDNYNVNPSYNENNQLVSNFISPFIEIPHIPSGTFNFTHKFTSESTVHTTSLDLSNAQSAEVSMSGVGPTLFKDIRYEIETFGYSEIGTLRAPRTVLYGDQDSDNHTYADSSSAIWSDGTARAAALASQSVSRFRVLTTIEEPFGPGVALPNIGLFTDDNNFSSSEPELIGSNFNLLINQNTANSITNDNNLSSSISSYVDKKLRTSITSSFVGQTIRSLLIANNNDTAGGGNFTVTSSLIYNMEGDWEPNISQIVDATNQTTLKILHVPPTIVRQIRFRIEDGGYSGELPPTSVALEVEVGATKYVTTRNVLYGDPSITNDGTGSGESGEHFANHINSILYASHSVTRFKPRAIIIEPVGHLHSNTTIVEQWSSSAHDNLDKTLTFNTESNGTTPSYNSPYGEPNQLVMGIQPDYVGQILSSSNQSGTTWIYTGSITHPNERGLNNPETPIFSEVIVKDTPDVEITRGIPLIETFGDSEIGIDNQNIANFANENFDRTLLAGFTETFPSSDGLIESTTASAVLRIQNQLKIKEPLGYAHKNITSSNFIIKNTDGSSVTDGPTVNNLIIEYNTSSTNLHTSGYDENFLLTSSYTSSFDSGGLSLPANGYVYQYDSVNFSFSNPASESLNASNTSKQLAFKVNEPSAIQIKNLFIEVENSNSGSNVGNRSSRSTQILFGNTTTETNITTNNTYPNSDSKNQLVSARVLLSQFDPVGTTHFTPTVVISGSLNSPSITFSTQSTDVSSSASLFIDNSLVVHYTSSFFPLEFGVGDNQTIIASASKVDDLGTVFTTESNSNLININVAAADTTNINITDLILKGAINTNNQFVYKLAHTSDQTITVEPDFSVGQPTIRTMDNVIFDDHLDITFDEVPNASDVFFSTAAGGKNPPNGTGSLKMDVSSIKTNTTPEIANIQSTVSTVSSLPADSDSLIEVINIIPAQPQVMNGNDWTKSFTNHDSLGIGANNFYTATLPGGLINSKSNSEPSGSVVTNIFITSKSDGTGNDYTITLSTPSSYTGNYDNNSRAYGYGDTGSLVVKINDDTVINANLATNFVPDANSGDQDLTGYDNDGFTDGVATFTSPYAGRGNLTLHKVSPFNGVSSSVLDGSTLYPNGYQAWNASLNITAKLQEGYNKVEFEHRIFPGTTHSLNTVEWYYDDGLLNPVIDTTSTITPSNFGEVTQSLSGISYFVKGASFTASIDDVFLNIANKTYRNTSNIIAKISEVDSNNGIQITPSIDRNPSFANNLEFQLNNTSNTNGLILSNGDPLVPTTTATGSIQNILIKGVDNVDNVGGRGELREAKIELAVRNNYGSGDNWSLVSHNFPIGRFIDGASFNSSATDLIEDFITEDRRHPYSTMSDETILTDNNITGSLMSGSFNSITSIASLKELQQIVGGTLQYPVTTNYNSYTNNDGEDVTIAFPSNNNFDVSFETSDRIVRNYYRAFRFNDLDINQFENITALITNYNDNSLFSGTTYTNNSKFTLKITYDGLEPSEATQSFGLGNLATPPNGGYDTITDIANNVTNNISIAVRIPGAIGPNNQNSSFPGTTWGVINNSQLTVFDHIQTSGTAFSAFDANSSDTVTHDETNKIISIKGIFPNNRFLHHTSGIILVRISIKHPNQDGGTGFLGTTSGNIGKITKIELEPR